jgi:transposase
MPCPASRSCTSNWNAWGLRQTRCVLVWKRLRETRENLYRFLESQGYQVWRLASPSNPSVCTAARIESEDRYIGCQYHCPSAARDGEARRGYVPTELIATYRELVRLHSQLSDEVARYKNEIHALLSVLFPEFVQIFTDPCRPTALGLLKRYRSRASVRGGWGRGDYSNAA